MHLILLIGLIFDGVYGILNLLGPVEAFLACFFTVTEILVQAFKQFVSLENTKVQ